MRRASSTLRKISFGCLAVALVACNGATASPAPPPSPAPNVTPTPSIVPTPTEAVAPLSLWLPASLAPVGSGEGARLFKAQLDAFSANRPAIPLTVAVKKDRGPGGLLDLLRAASPVAPAALPDVILLNDADLAIAAREGLIQPLDTLLDARTETSLFPFARQAARIDGKRMGMPLVVDFNHLALDPERTDLRPGAWTELMSNTLAYPFAFAEGEHVSDNVLADYAALGGTIINGEGQPALNLDALTQLLSLYRDARTAGVIGVANAEWDNQETVWSMFRASHAPLAAVTASRYLSTRAEGTLLDFAPAPAIDTRPTLPIGRSWNLAVVSRESERQQLAAELIGQLSQFDNTAWTQAQHVLPASANALQSWDPFDRYADFARAELSRAVPPPSPAALEAVSPAFLNAIRDVLSGRETPQAAAAQAVDAVQRGKP